jgi:uncharacterized protein (DUF1499 family)
MNQPIKNPISLVVMNLILLFMITQCAGTRPGDLGIRENGKLANCPSTPNCVSSFSNPQDTEHFMEAIPYKQPLKDAISSLKEVLTKQSRVVIVNETNQYIYAEFTSLIMRYVDDVEFYFDDKNKVLHFRSASRLGKSDFGVNRKRLGKIILELDWK